MKRSFCRLALTLLGAAALAPAALAGGDMMTETTATYGGTTVWVGGGFQFLSLPDIKFVGAGPPGDFVRRRNSDFDEYGWATGGGLETGLGYWGNYRVSGSVKGFFANADHDDRHRCRASTCTVIDPTGAGPLFGPPTLLTTTSRDVDYWGGSIEAKFWELETVKVRPNLYRNDYFIIGADVRGIEQDSGLRGQNDGNFIYNYAERLDTTYYGGYVGIGGEYSLGFLGATGVTGILDRLGLRSFIEARAGLYNAETEYRGTFFDLTGFNSALARSNNELAFIGSISLETRKQIGSRSSLSLWTDYEYISSVPQMHYANGSGRPTRIEDGDAFASRTMLRLNIGLGPEALYPPPP